MVDASSLVLDEWGLVAILGLAVFATVSITLGIFRVLRKALDVMAIPEPSKYGCAMCDFLQARASAYFPFGVNGRIEKRMRFRDLQMHYDYSHGPASLPIARREEEERERKREEEGA